MKYQAYSEKNDQRDSSQTAFQMQSQPFKKGDYLILFGELFNRGYANGLLEAAESLGLNIIRSTVGRRGTNNELRPLNAEEIPASEHRLINIPLEAGFDFEKVNGVSVSDLLADVKISTWTDFTLDPVFISKAKEQGQKRFRESTKTFIAEITKIVPAGTRVHFAHLMAGGVPRSRIFMPLMNRVFKGTGDRHLESQVFWDSAVGKICSESFTEVSAQTLRILLEETESFRARAGAGMVSYSAYGYHGTEVWKSDSYQWQSYAPYLQGWAKMELEKISTEFFKKGVNTVVSNCPEILTNSSSIFQGVEVPLYTLIKGIENEAKKLNTDLARSAHVNLVKKCQNLLKPETSVDAILEICKKTLCDSNVEHQSEFKTWPQHNTKAQMEVLLKGSDQIIDSHKDPKLLMTSELSEIVLKACGAAVLDQAVRPLGPVTWINHDFVARHFLSQQV